MAAQQSHTWRFSPCVEIVLYSHRLQYGVSCDALWLWYCARPSMPYGMAGCDPSLTVARHVGHVPLSALEPLPGWPSDKDSQRIAQSR